MRVSRGLGLVMALGTILWLNHSTLGAQPKPKAKADNADAAKPDAKPGADILDLGDETKPGAAKTDRKAPADPLLGDIEEKGTTSSKGTKDPVTAAFALPRGVTLSGKYLDMYKKLKDEYEPQLRAALDHVAQAKASKDSADASKAAKEVAEVRTKIKKGIKQIGLSMQQDAYSAAAKQQKNQPNNNRGRGRGR